jgi:hypothetical protein
MNPISVTAVEESFHEMRVTLYWPDIFCYTFVFGFWPRYLFMVPDSCWATVRNSNSIYILVNKKNIFGGVKRGRKKIDNIIIYIVEKYKIYIYEFWRVFLKIYTSDWNSFGINIGGWAGDYNIQSTNFCRIAACNERCINRVHLTFSLYTNCQNQ